MASDFRLTETPRYSWYPYSVSEMHSMDARALEHIKQSHGLAVGNRSSLPEGVQTVTLTLYDGTSITVDNDSYYPYMSDTHLDAGAWKEIADAFQLRDPEKIRAFLSVNRPLVDFLCHEVAPNLHAVFGPDTALRLSVFEDLETGESELSVHILVKYHSELRAKLRKLRESWWFDVAQNLRDKVVIGFDSPS